MGPLKIIFTKSSPSGPQISPWMFWWVIGPSIGVNKWINKIGQKRILIDITEFTTNTTSVIMHFCHIEKHLTVKHCFGARLLESANKFCHHLLTLMSFQMTFFCGTQKKRFCIMLPNHFGYSWFRYGQTFLEILKLCSTEEINEYRVGMT